MRRRPWWPAVLLAAAAAGCSGGGVGKVTGRVTLDGAPLADAEVVFCPKDDPKATTSFARTRADGTFEWERNPRSGRTLQPGNYVVLVSRMVKTKDGSVPGADEDRAMLLAGGSLRNSLPPTYSDVATSPLNASLKPGDNALPAFELTSR